MIICEARRAAITWRNKLSQDPNNTLWSKSTNSYGHKILSAQGWKPGDYLGAENASHADHYTGANASHIRVLLREDNLGLGAQVGRVNADTFGLSLFSGVLGRLNGKSDADVQKHQSALRDAELRTYQAQKYGYMNFVSGGLLVGDRIESLAEYEGPSQKEDAVNKSGVDDAGRKRKKRKIELHTTEEEGNLETTTLDGQRRETNATPQDESADMEDSTPEPKLKEKSRKKSTSSKKTKAMDDSDVNTPEDDRARRKQEHRARKEERRKRKEEKRQLSVKPEHLDIEQRQSDSVSEAPSAPKNAAIFAGNRNAVRRRYIEQKRMASLDPKAMNEIFMLKAVG